MPAAVEPARAGAAAEAEAGSAAAGKTGPGRAARARPEKVRLSLHSVLVGMAVLPALLIDVLLLGWLSRRPDVGFNTLVGVGLILLVGIAAITVAAREFARWTVRRLRRLADGLQRVQMGDYKSRLSCDFGDELGILAMRIDDLSSAAGARERRIIENALIDPLTGLHSRTLLSDRIQAAINHAQRTTSTFALSVLDLDRFKFVNDTLGHAVGDKLLKEVARRLKATVRSTDTIARLGGDEFVLLLPGSLEAAREVAERVLRAMRDPLRTDGQLIDIGVSMGLSVFPDHGQDEATLLRHADVAMYRAKRQQKGCVVFDGDAGEVRRSYLSMLGEMRTALDKGQLFLEYQPKLNLRSGLIVGAEGLVRWNHPVRGRMPPNEFIPFAEQSGFMRELTRWVIREGARFVTTLDQAMDLKISVNVTAADLVTPDFCGYVADVIHELKVPRHRLCLEITESGMVSEAESALRNLKELSALGVLLAVDDFGTGYATLKQLQQLPVNELKIDRSFVSGMHQNRGNQSIIRATTEMAKQLGMSVVAEGVETVKELRAIAALGCDEVQGYYVAKPMAGADLPGWIETRNALYATSRQAHFAMLTSDAR